MRQFGWAGPLPGAHLKQINVILVHVGHYPPPPYLASAIAQVRATNPLSDNVHIWVIMDYNSTIFSSLPLPLATSTGIVDPYIHFVAPSSLVADVGKGHYKDQGFWRMTTERLFYVASLATREDLRNIILLESDNLLYAHLRELLPQFQALYPGTGATRDSPERGIAGLMWCVSNLQSRLQLTCRFANPSSLAHFGSFVRKEARASVNETNDMILLNRYFEVYGSDPSILSNLPVLPEYHALSAGSHMRAREGTTAVTTVEGVMAYARNNRAFGTSRTHGVVGGIFDAAAVGQYLFGTDNPRGKWTAGFINEAAVYQLGRWTYVWRVEVYANVSGYCPYLVENPDAPESDWRLHKINNLHTHHKNLAYQRAQPDGPVIRSGALVHEREPRLETEAEAGMWADRWNVQTTEFRSAMEQGKLFEILLNTAESQPPLCPPTLTLAPPLTL